MNKNQELFEKAPVSKAVAVMAIPTMISMLVVVIYNMADTFFIGQTNDPMKVAAVSLATPIFMVFMALGNLFGIGGSSAISRALGEHKPEKAKHIAIESGKYRGLATPQNIPAEARQYLETKFAELCANPEYQKAVKSSGLMPQFQTGKASGEIIRPEG